MVIPIITHHNRRSIKITISRDTKNIILIVATGETPQR
jgi:hypothetical protein